MRFQEWYKKLRPAKQLTIYFLIFFLLWISFKCFGYFFLGDDTKPYAIAKIFTSATFQAVLFTALFKWELVKQTFKKEKKNF